MISMISMITKDIYDMYDIYDIYTVCDVCMTVELRKSSVADNCGRSVDDGRRGEVTEPPQAGWCPNTITRGFPDVRLSVM